jgi:uncharacterized membrane protein YphA (DoxX/SURF4 family)
MPSVKRFIEHRLDKQVSSLGLGVFRVAYGCVLFLEVAQLFYFRHFFFDPIPYVSPRTTDMTFALSVWLVVIACLTIGLFTRPAAIVNYAFTIMTLGRFSTFEYHHDYILIGVNFLLMFLPVGRRLSVDRLIKSRPSATRSSSSEPPCTVSVLAYEVPVFLGIALVYFDSAVFKIFSPMWAAGLGLWQPASAPYATFVDWSWLLDQRALIQGLGFLVILFEAAFIFLMWFRQARIPLLVLGIGLHLGILLIFALPLFALGVASLFLLMVPAGWWENLAARASAPLPRAARSGEPVGSARFRSLAASLITGFLALTVVSQTLCVLASPPLLRSTKPLRDTRVYKGWRKAARMLLGIHPHAVFMDSRYGPYAKQFAVVHVDEQGRKIWLPVVTPRGHASVYSTGRQQVYWMHRVNGQELQPKRMERGIRRLTAFWAHKYGVDLQDAAFLILARDLKRADGWEAGLLHRQYEQPWITVGTANWSGGGFTLNMTGLEGQSR